MGSKVYITQIFLDISWFANTPSSISAGFLYPKGILSFKTTYHTTSERSLN